MVWTRFSYICRKANAEYKTQGFTALKFSEIEQNAACNLYGNKARANTWPQVLLDKIGAISNEDKAVSAVKIYQELDLNGQIEDLKNSKRIIAYLSLVAVIFYISTTVYQFTVIPFFIGSFDVFNIKVPDVLLIQQDYWWAFILTISVLLMISFTVAMKIRGLFKFTVNIEKSLMVKYLVFSDIKKSYLRLINLLQFPLYQDKTLADETSLALIEHLIAVNENTEMSLPKEIQALIQIEQELLSSLAERQLKIMTSIIALLLISAICCFLINAYSPIFFIGETI
ncbi:hypothetical protein N9W21_03300 [Shewanella sp.]|nr:hypothetical protein [Shewanella sp.]